MKARTGKIARLPRHIREELNRRLADGESGKEIVTWLNNLPEVREVLVRDFAGRRILEQNLSDWRSGGYRDWCAHQETLERMRHFDEEADELGEVGRLLSDRLSRLISVRYVGLLTATAAIKDWRKPRNRELLRQLTEDVVALRRGDHSAERLRLEREQLEIERARVRELTEEGHWEWASRNVDCICKGYVSTEQKIAGLYKNVFGFEIDDDEMERPLDASAGSPPPQAETSTAEKTGAECGGPSKSPKTAAQGDQTQSSPIKP